MQHCGLRGACLPGALLHCGRDPGTQKCFGAGDVSAVDVKGGVAPFLCHARDPTG